MSNYFVQRTKNLPTNTNSNNNASRLAQPKKAATTVKSEPVITISDDELLDSVLEFEKTSEFKQAEEAAKKARGGRAFNSSNVSHMFLQSLKSIPPVFVHFINYRVLLRLVHHHLSKVRSFSCLFKYELISLGSASTSAIPSTNSRLKPELHTIVASSLKRSHSGSDDDDVIALNTTSPSIVRPPVKKLPNSKPDFHSFAPKDGKFSIYYR
jgi:hypothetical protein